MQSTSNQFAQYAISEVRPLSYALRISFDKTVDSSLTFFILDTSILDGTDILAPSNDNEVQEWDKYAYADYTDKVISIEVTREEVEPYSIAQAYADITLNNYDSYFTPNSGSPIDSNILPRRPFRALLGFGGEVVPQIVGLSEGMPDIDKASRTAKFHIIDFMSFVLDQDISETILLENVKTHEVLDYLFQFMGLLSSQYTLDSSLNTIKFFSVDKGTKFKTVVDKLMEAEIGRLYMDEAGIIRFKNRYNYATSPVYTFDKSNVIDYKLSDELPVINSVKVKSEVRAVQALQSVYTNTTPTLVKTGETIELFAEFQDPVTTINDPVYSAVEINDSYFTTTLNEDGTGVYTDIDCTLELFSKSAKLTFENTGSSPAYVKAIDLYGTPAKVVDTIKVEEVNAISIDNYGEQPHDIDNPYIQDESNAQSVSLILLHDYSQYGSGIDIEAKGSPALQLGDPVDIDLDGYQGVYVITKAISILSEGKLEHRYRVRDKIPPAFFILDSSLLDGEAILQP